MRSYRGGCRFLMRLHHRRKRSGLVGRGFCLAAAAGVELDTCANGTRSLQAMTDVSVLLVTHNHARFIEQAVESVLAQETSRSFELIVSEDTSTDGTREIVEELAGRDPRIRTLYSERNLKSNEPVLRAL